LNELFKLFCSSDFTGLPDVPGIAPLPSFVTSPSDVQPSRGSGTGKMVFPDIRYELGSLKYVHVEKEAF